MEISRVFVNYTKLCRALVLCVGSDTSFMNSICSNKTPDTTQYSDIKHF